MDLYPEAAELLVHWKSFWSALSVRDWKDTDVILQRSQTFTSPKTGEARRLRGGSSYALFSPLPVSHAQEARVP